MHILQFARNVLIYVQNCYFVSLRHVLKLEMAISVFELEATNLKLYMSSRIY